MVVLVGESAGRLKASALALGEAADLLPGRLNSLILNVREATICFRGFP